jgi:hypothetical protein
MIVGNNHNGACVCQCCAAVRLGVYCVLCQCNVVLAANILWCSCFSSEVPVLRPECGAFLCRYRNVWWCLSL